MFCEVMDVVLPGAEQISRGAKLDLVPGRNMAPSHEAFFFGAVASANDFASVMPPLFFFYLGALVKGTE